MEKCRSFIHKKNSKKLAFKQYMLDKKKAAFAQ